MSALSKLNTRAPLDRSPKSNWVEESGGLPMYIRRIANHLHAEKGMTISHAIAVAVNAVKKMCGTGDVNWPGRQNVNAGSRAEACASVASWEKKKAGARVSKGVLGRKWSDEEFIDFIMENGGTDEIHKASGDGKCHVCEFRRRRDAAKKKKNRYQVKKEYDPNQPRDPRNGRWIPTGKELFLRGKELTEFDTLEDEQKIQYANVKHSPEGIAAQITHSQALASAQSYDAEALRRAYEIIDRMNRGEKISTADLEEEKPKKRRVKKRYFSSEQRKKATTYPGTDKFPIETQEDLNNAWKLRGNSSIPKEKVEAYIRHCAKAKGLKVPGDVEKVKAPEKRPPRSPGKKGISDEEFNALEEEINADGIHDEDEDIESFEVSGQIEKRDDEKQLVFGWCSIAKHKDGTVEVDKQGDVLEDIDQMEKVAYDFVLHSRDGGEMHVRKGVSTLVESFVSTPEKWEAMEIPEGVLPVGWWVGFHVHDNEVWKGVKEGKYKMFSVHGSGVRKELKE